MQDLKSRTVRAGLITVGSRGVGFAIRVLALMVMGRLLTPEDYGLVTMVTASTGMLNMFGCFGLFQAAIQRGHGLPQILAVIREEGTKYGSVGARQG